MTCLSKQTYQPGDVILANCKPLIKILEKKYKASRCDWCFNINNVLKKCQGCKEMHYCDKQCQLQDWKNGHKLECQLSCFAEKICGNLNWLVLKIVLRIFATLKINSKKATEGLPIPDGTVRSFKNLLDHAESETDAFLVSVLSKLKILLQGEGHQVETDELLKFYSIHKTNGFAIYNKQESAKIGTGLYVQTSVFDHSCKPNVFFVTFGTEMQIRATGPIMVGESICISYISANMGRDDRRQTLNEQYRFDCNCERCAANLDFNLDFKSLERSIEVMKEKVANPPFTKEGFLSTSALHNKILEIFRKIYHEYDYRITNQYCRMFQAMEEYALKMKKRDVELILKDVLDHVLVTYGKDHFEYELLRGNFSYIGFEYLLTT